MQGRSPVRLALGVAVTALAAMAIAAPAMATQVTPTNTATTMNLKSGTFARLIPTNAFSEFYISCNKLEMKFTTPKSTAGTLFNTNRAKTGTYSVGAGSVTMATTSSPVFGGCGVYQTPAHPEKEQGTLIYTPTVTVTSGWIVGAEGISATEGALMVDVPKNGVAFSAAGVCTTTASPNGPGLVLGRYQSATKEAKVDGQIAFSNTGAGCTGTSPGQLEASLLADKELSIVP